MDDLDDLDESEDGVTLEAETLHVDPLPGEAEAADLLERSRKLLPSMHAEDREEAIDLHEKIEVAIDSGDAEALTQASKALRELLFFMAGKPN